eukprot:gnl/TRDRNA2_/TRDRNA2_189621_c0_seq1.p1 gnl/TRDRNA2_/TRDRNA2_189621_c0~~gnl/TRDRNA2_/TRDRNA2_189621_c0_seq1.p1  ORF type:complete len:368 (+),score=62.36 gnl/TRDRNA2_/TRDRNA2_189621_c0_seq1:79-1182(+)
MDDWERKLQELRDDPQALVASVEALTVDLRELQALASEAEAALRSDKGCGRSLVRAVVALDLDDLQRPQLVVRAQLEEAEETEWLSASELQSRISCFRAAVGGSGTRGSWWAPIPTSPSNQVERSATLADVHALRNQLATVRSESQRAAEQAVRAETAAEAERAGLREQLAVARRQLIEAEKAAARHQLQEARSSFSAKAEAGALRAELTATRERQAEAENRALAAIHAVTELHADLRKAPGASQEYLLWLEPRLEQAMKAIESATPSCSREPPRSRSASTNSASGGTPHSRNGTQISSPGRDRAMTWGSSIPRCDSSPPHCESFGSAHSREGSSALELDSTPRMLVSPAPAHECCVGRCSRRCAVM